MQVINEVREESNHKEKLYPVATAANSAAAAIKVKALNKTLEKNRAIFQGLRAQLMGRQNGALNQFTPAELKQYNALEHVEEIQEYRSDFINDKRIEKYNPMQADKIVPLSEKITKQAEKNVKKEAEKKAAEAKAKKEAKEKAEKAEKEAEKKKEKK